MQVDPELRAVFFPIEFIVDEAPVFIFVRYPDT